MSLHELDQSRSLRFHRHCARRGTSQPHCQWSHGCCSPPPLRRRRRRSCFDFFVCQGEYARPPHDMPRAAFGAPLLPVSPLSRGNRVCRRRSAARCGLLAESMKRQCAAAAVTSVAPHGVTRPADMRTTATGPTKSEKASARHLVRFCAAVDSSSFLVATKTKSALLCQRLFFFLCYYFLSTRSQKRYYFSRLHILSSAQAQHLFK